MRHNLQLCLYQRKPLGWRSSNRPLLICKPPEIPSSCLCAALDGIFDASLNLSVIRCARCHKSSGLIPIVENIQCPPLGRVQLPSIHFPSSTLNRSANSAGVYQVKNEFWLTTQSPQRLLAHPRTHSGTVAVESLLYCQQRKGFKGMHVAMSSPSILYRNMGNSSKCA
jgi:hypothetical protein